MRFKRVRFEQVVAPAAAVPANGQANAQMTVDGDYDLEVDTVKVQRTNAALTVQMFDAAAGGAGYQSAPVPIDLWGGTAQLPLTMIPQLWKKRQQFSFTFVDASGAPNTVTLVFGGYKLVPLQPDEEKLLAQYQS